MGSQSQAPSSRMSRGQKWLIGIGVFLGLGLVGGLLEALGVIDDEPAAQPTTQPPTTAASTAPATATAEPPFWPNQPTDGVWALDPGRVDPEDVVPFGEVSPPIYVCSPRDFEEGTCDAVTVRIDGPPTLTRSDGLREVVMSSRFTVERIMDRGGLGHSAKDLVDTIYLEPRFNSYSDGWDEVTGEASVWCPEDDLAVGESMQCSVAIAAEYDWIENSAWWLVRQFYLGTWPSQQEFDPSNSVYEGSR